MIAIFFLFVLYLFPIKFCTPRINTRIDHGAGQNVSHVTRNAHRRTLFAILKTHTWFGHYQPHASHELYRVQPYTAREDRHNGGGLARERCVYMVYALRGWATARQHTMWWPRRSCLVPCALGAITPNWTEVDALICWYGVHTHTYTHRRPICVLLEGWGIIVWSKESHSARNYGR